MNVHYFQHVPFEGLGCIEQWMTLHGHELACTRFYSGDELPLLKAIDWLIILGGPMGIYDHGNHPWLLDEKRFIGRAIDAGKTVIGICLGAQLVADVLGAKVFKNRYKEIGWYPIHMTEESRKYKPFNTFPKSLDVFHWHGDTFDLPKDAIRLAGSAATENQAYMCNKNVMGIQFHLEMTVNNAKKLIENGLHELVDEPYIQSSDAMLSSKARFSDINRKMNTILAALVDLPKSTLS